MTEEELEARDSRNGVPLLEALVVLLAAVEILTVIGVAIWLW